MHFQQNSFFSIFALIVSLSLLECTTGILHWRLLRGTNQTSLRAVRGRKGTGTNLTTPGSYIVDSVVLVNSTFYVFQENSLWSMDRSDLVWVWIAGNPDKLLGVYGEKGLEDARFNPPGRLTCSIANVGHYIFMFAGYGTGNSGRYGNKNDLWRLNLTSLKWAWLSGESTRKSPGNYSTKGVYAKGLSPSARSGHSVAIIDTIMYMFGGNMLSDLWGFNTSDATWAWLHGQSSDVVGVYGARGVETLSVHPGSRESSHMVAYQKKLYMFGGYGHDCCSSKKYLNDMWSFNPGTRSWTWVSGSTSAESSDNQYAVLFEESENAFPAGRRSGVFAVHNEMLLIRGGRSSVVYADMWAYILNSGVFVWIGGSSEINLKGNHTKNGHPGSRHRGVAAAIDDSFILFGGQPLSGGTSRLADLWEFLLWKCSNVTSFDFEAQRCVSSCAPGKFKGTNTCLKCPKNTYSNASTFGKCTPCGPQLRSSLGATECTPCLPGEFSTQLRCVVCPAGRFSNASAMTSCLSCGLGLGSGPGESICSECSAGKYSTGNGCLTCDFDTYSNKTGSSQCFACAAGYSSQKGAPNCSRIQPLTWKWSLGSSSASIAPVFGVINVPDRTSTPGSRVYMSSTVYKDEIFVFGGKLNTNPIVSWNDLWKLSGDIWVWISGDSVSLRPIYGLLSSESPLNRIGARYGAGMESFEDCLYVFGGGGQDYKRSFGGLNDVWRFNLTRNLWAWISGTSESGHSGRVGVPGEYRTDYVPSGRIAHATTLLHSVIYVLGGMRSGDINLSYNDFWAFDILSRTWAVLVARTFLLSAYGAKRHPAGGFPTNSRHTLQLVSSKDSLYVFGGCTKFLCSTVFSDVWKYTPGKNRWVWVMGVTRSEGLGHYEDLYSESLLTYPGGRAGSATALVNQDGFLLYGGTHNGEKMSDLWFYAFSSDSFTWIGGSQSSNSPPVHSKDADAFPGNRVYSMAEVTSSGFFLYGGTVSGAEYSDMWILNLWQCGTSLRYDFGKKDCVQCGIGKFKGHSLCLSCAPGRFSSSNHTSKCLPCTPGYSSSLGAAECFACPPGKFTSSPGDSCRDCLLNTYSYKSGSRTCAPCPEGTYAPRKGAINCTEIDIMSWKWVSGESHRGLLPVYGRQKTFHYDNRVGSRVQAGMAYCRGYVYVFGGKDPFESLKNDLWRFNMTSGLWSWMSGDIFSLPGTYAGGMNMRPGARSRHTLDSVNDSVFVFGGFGYAYNATLGYLNDMWSFNTSILEWNWLSGSTEVDGILRAGHSSAVADEIIYVFGGNGQRDLLSFDTTSGQWAMISNVSGGLNGDYGQNSAYPGVRISASLVYYRNALYLFGGQGYDCCSLNTIELNDFWTFGIDSSEWTWMGGASKDRDLGNYLDLYEENVAAFPASRYGASLQVYKDSLILFGGRQLNGVMRDLWVYSFNSSLFTRIHGDKKLEVEADYEKSDPGSRFWMPSLLVDRTLLIFGGLGIRQELGITQYYSDIWSFGLWNCDTNEGYDNRTKTCAQCSAGKFQSQIRLCNICSRGSISAREGATFCTHCPDGSESLKNASFCTVCGKGEYAKSGAICVACPRGRFASSLGSSYCSYCTPGYESSTGGSFCSECQIGYYSPNGVTCSQCAGRLVTNVTQSSSCTECAVGRIPDILKSDCVECSPGTYAIGTRCVACAIHQYSSTAGSEFCEQCPRKQWTLAPGSSACEFCTRGDVEFYGPESPEKKQDCFCKEGYYGAPFLPGRTCTKCLESVSITCPENTTLPLVKEGFARSSIDPSVSYRCTPPSACLASGTAAVTPCARGYTADLCSDCAANFFRSKEECKECSPWARFSFVFYFAAVLLGLYVLIQNSVPSNRKMHAPVIAFFWLQILDSVSSDVEWPRAVRWVFILAQLLTFDLDVFEPECSFRVGYWVKWHIKMTAVLLLGATQLYFFVYQENVLQKRYIFDKQYPKRLFNWLKYVSRNATSLKGIQTLGKDFAQRLLDIAKHFHPRKLMLRNPKPEAPELTLDTMYDTEKLTETYPYRFSRYVHSFGYLLNSLYVVTAKTSFEMFRCNYNADSTYRMNAYVMQECYDAYWWQVLFTNVVFSTYLLIGFPGYLVWLLWVKRNDYESEEFENNFGAFTVFYTDAALLWPVAEIVLKCIALALSRIVVFWFPNTGYVLLISVFLLYDGLCIALRPYVLKSSLLLSLAYVFMICVISTSFLTQSAPGSHSVWISVLILLSLSCVAVCTVWSVRISLRNETKEVVAEKSKE